MPHQLIPLPAILTSDAGETSRAGSRQDVFVADRLHDSQVRREITLTLDASALTHDPMLLVT